MTFDFGHGGEGREESRGAEVVVTGFWLVELDRRRVLKLTELVQLVGKPQELSQDQ